MMIRGSGNEAITTNLLKISRTLKDLPKAPRCLQVCSWWSLQENNYMGRYLRRSIDLSFTRLQWVIIDTQDMKPKYLELELYLNLVGIWYWYFLLTALNNYAIRPCYIYVIRYLDFLYILRRCVVQFLSCIKKLRYLKHSRSVVMSVEVLM
jgi:hypothetical protein